jgi:hypothetical protein
MEGKRRPAIIRKGSLAVQWRGQRAPRNKRPKAISSCSFSHTGELCRLLELFQFSTAFVLLPLNPYEVWHHVYFCSFFGVFSGVTPKERRLEKHIFYPILFCL